MTTKHHLMNMHKRHLIVLLISFITTIPSLAQETAQLDCQAVAQENEQLTSTISEKEQTIESLTTKTVKLESDIKYFKESLNLLSSELSVESDDITYIIASVTGKRDQDEIIVELLIENQGAVRRLQDNGQIFIIDPKGNQIKYNYRKTDIGNESSIAKFQRDIPIKMTIGFDDVVEEVPTLKALVLGFHNLDEVVFKNLDVTWE